jgi:hypothetical protein
MTHYALFLTLLYVVIAALLLIACLRTHWSRWIKIGMIVLVTGSYFVANVTFDEMQGWPTASDVPEKFVFHWAVIEEPNKDKGTDGAIYIWASALDDHHPDSVPRAYKLPYLKDAHSTINDAIRRARAGSRQIGSAERPGGGSGNAWFKVNASRKIVLTISDAPAARMPEK